MLKKDGNIELSKSTLNSSYYIIKLKTGETLFSEVHQVDDKLIYLQEPIYVRSVSVSDTSDAMIGSAWIPFISEESNKNVKLPLSMVYYFEFLSPKYVKFYGSVLLREAIIRIKEDTADQIENKNDYMTMMNSVYEMEKVSEHYSKKFDIEGIDTQEFKEAAKKFKPAFH